jgi:hypothetical protein
MIRAHEENAQGRRPSPRDLAMGLVSTANRETILKLAADQGIVDDDPLWLMLSAALRAENAADRSSAVLAEIKSVLAQQPDVLKITIRSATLAAIDETAERLAEQLAEPNQKRFEAAYRAGSRAERIRAFTAALMAMTAAAGVGMIFGSVRWDIPMPEKVAFFFDAPLGFLLIAQLAGLAVAAFFSILKERRP